MLPESPFPHPPFGHLLPVGEGKANSLAIDEGLGADLQAIGEDLPAVTGARCVHGECLKLNADKNKLQEQAQERMRVAVAVAYKSREARQAGRGKPRRGGAHGCASFSEQQDAASENSPACLRTQRLHRWAHR